MVGNFEFRRFSNGEKLWIGHYRNLTNVLHWHMESELIWVISGQAQIRIGDDHFDAQAGDVFYCAGEQLHYIASQSNTRITVVIADLSAMQEFLDYSLFSPLLPPAIEAAERIKRMDRLLQEKGFLYQESLEHEWRGLMLDTFRHLSFYKKEKLSQEWKKLLHSIRSNYANITFADAVKASGYSAAHFSKLFKKLTGISFSGYLNVVRVEQAIAMMRNEPKRTMTDVAMHCGFSTVRNFNRVFRDVTGYAPRYLPADIMIDAYQSSSDAQHFDPTSKTSIIIDPKNA